MCGMVTRGVTAWVNYRAQYPGQGTVDRALCTWLSSAVPGTKLALDEAVEKTREQWVLQNTENQEDKVSFAQETGNTLTRAKSALLVEYKRVGHSRKLKWIPNDECFY
jgi:hypothetical protein